MNVPTPDEVREAIRNFDDGIESQRDSLILKNYAEAAARENAALRERVIQECVDAIRTTVVFIEFNGDHDATNLAGIKVREYGNKVIDKLESMIPR